MKEIKNQTKKEKGNKTLSHKKEKGMSKKKKTLTKSNKGRNRRLRLWHMNC
jgi:hypothetical protein